MRSEEEVRKAYRRAALKYHPDKASAACRFEPAVPLEGGGGGGSSAGGAGTGGGGGAAGVPLEVAGGASEADARVREEAAWLFNLINQVRSLYLEY